MLTPLDIENREFKKTLNGYNRDDVEDFMCMVLDDYEKLYKESSANKQEIEKLTAQLEEYKSQESTLRDAIVTAQRASDDLENSARQRAELIVSQANVKASEIIRDASAQITDIENKYKELVRQMENYKLRMSNMIRSQLDIMDKIADSDYGFPPEKKIDVSQVSAAVSTACVPQTEEGNTEEK